MTDKMLQNIIKYYKKVTDMALVNLKNEKQFQFKKMLTNTSLMQVTENNLLKLHDSKKARKLINEYKIAMNNMYILAQKEYNKALKLIKATKDQNLKQKILNDFADRGINGFIAKNGAKWNIETYSNMFTIHVYNTLANMRVIENADINSKFLISNHNTICDLCIPFEGETLTRSELETARGSGLFHPRCLHFVVEVKT